LKKGIKITEIGRDNRLDLDAHEVSGALTINIYGDRNTIQCGPGTNFRRARITIVGSGNTVRVGRCCKVGLFVTACAEGTWVELGDMTTMFGAHFELDESCSVRIGRDCMFSGGIWVSASDTLSILDLESGERLSRGDDIVIEDHVWIGRDSKILKGAKIGTGSVIGAGSVVSEALPANCAAAGVPARVIRRNIVWRRRPVEEAFDADAGSAV
jgi:acetyltransferase-like isoleucine patch superfamily enzyme